MSAPLRFLVTTAVLLTALATGVGVDAQSDAPGPRGRGPRGMMGEPQMADLKKLLPERAVQAVKYCKGQYFVSTAAGDVLAFSEFNLRIKSDSSDKGPHPGKPALLSAAMMGDRAFLVFSDPAEILNFVFAACTDVCPLHSDLIGQIQAKTKALRNKVQFITITTHPEFDGPEVLKPYGALHGLDSENWTFLTSGPERPSDTRDLAESYGVKFTPLGNGQFVHGVVTHVIDQNGMLRARYHGLRFNLMNLVVHVNTLINDYH